MEEWGGQLFPGSSPNPAQASQQHSHSSQTSDSVCTTKLSQRARTFQGDWTLHTESSAKESRFTVQMLCSSNRCLFWSHISPTASPNYCRGSSRRFFNSEANSSKRINKLREGRLSLSNSFKPLRGGLEAEGDFWGFAVALRQHSTSNCPSGWLSNHSFVETPSLSPPHPTHLVQ